LGKKEIHLDPHKNSVVWGKKPDGFRNGLLS
jgi:hypothetical protein